MFTRVLIVVLAIGAAACFGGKKWIVPNTPEGGACSRECIALKNQCIGAGGSFGCATQHDECLSTCPGATQR